MSVGAQTVPSGSVSILISSDLVSSGLVSAEGETGMAPDASSLISGCVAGSGVVFGATDTAAEPLLFFRGRYHSVAGPRIDVDAWPLPLHY